jgi:hypothetical protein
MQDWGKVSLSDTMLLQWGWFSTRGRSMTFGP